METAGGRRARLSGVARLRNSGRFPAGFCSGQSSALAIEWDAPFAIVAFVNNLDMGGEIAQVRWTFRFEC
jgi:hypothetical protein